MSITGYFILDKKMLAEYLSEKLNIKPENQFNDSVPNLSLENLHSCTDWIFIGK